jgi:hypothetical protein
VKSKKHRLTSDAFLPHTITRNLLRTFEPDKTIFLSMLINKHSREYWMAISDECNYFFSKIEKEILAQGWIDMTNEELVDDYSFSLKMISKCQRYFKKLLSYQ